MFPRSLLLLPCPTAMNESQFQRRVVKAAEQAGWRVFHTPRSDRIPYRTSPGFPDLVLCNGRHTIFAELKTDEGQLSSEQDKWHGDLIMSGERCEIWRPRMWDQIVRTLAGQ